MKNKLLLGILAILLISMIQVNASPSPPYTFNGQYNVYGEPCDNCEISFRYLDSREDKDWKTTLTNNYGDYQFTNKFFKDGDWYRPGDRVEIKFCNDNIQSLCSQIVRFGDGAGTWTNVQIEKDNIYDIIESNGNTVVIITDDSSMVIVVPKRVICEDGSDQIDGKCPTDIWDELFYVFVGVLSTFGFGAGFIGLLKYYWTTKGTKLIREGKMYNNSEMIAEGKKYRRRALKMGLTAIKRAALGQYDKYRKGG